jgi:hypothetical protein
MKPDCQHVNTIQTSYYGHTLPRPPATGPSRTVTPLSRFSTPIALPRSCARRLLQVAPTLIPAGKTETRLRRVSNEPILIILHAHLGNVLGISHAEWGILKTLSSNAQTRHAAGLANTLFLLPSSACFCKYLLSRMMGVISTPVVRLTFSSRVNCLTTSLAFSYAFAQSPSPLPQGLGYLGGDV